jgi:hypothetical protein
VGGGYRSCAPCSTSCNHRTTYNFELNSIFHYARSPAEIDKASARALLAARKTKYLLKVDTYCVLTVSRELIRFVCGGVQWSPRLSEQLPAAGSNHLLRLLRLAWCTPVGGKRCRAELIRRLVCW